MKRLDGWETSQGIQISREQLAELEAEHGVARVCLACKVTHFFATAALALGRKCEQCGGPLESERDILRRGKRLREKANKRLAKLQGVMFGPEQNRRARRAAKAKARRK